MTDTGPEQEFIDPYMDEDEEWDDEAVSQAASEWQRMLDDVKVETQDDMTRLGMLNNEELTGLIAMETPEQAEQRQEERTEAIQEEAMPGLEGTLPDGAEMLSEAEPETGPSTTETE